MNLPQLYYYRMLGRVGSFSKAADKLFITQPALSIAIKNLEKEFGCALIERKRNTIEFTEVGKNVYISISQASQILDDCIEGVKQQNESEANNLHIGIVFSAQDRIWASILREFTALKGFRPQIILTQNTSEKLLEMLKIGEVDVTISGTIGNTSALEQVPCWSIPAALVVNKKHHLAKREYVSLDELKQERIISYLREAPCGNETLALLAGHDLSVQHAYLDEITMCSIISSDPKTIGIMVSSWLVPTYPDVIAIPIKEAPENFHKFWLSYRPNPLKNTLLSDFIEFVKKFDYETVSRFPL